MTKMELPENFAEEIATVLDVNAAKVQEFFEIGEDKQGWFYAKKRPKIWLDKIQFKALCSLCREYGGQYVSSEYTFKIPGPYAKNETSPQEKTTAPKESTGVTPHVVTTDKSPPPNIPKIKIIAVASVKVPTFLPTRELISHERLSEIRDSIKRHGLKYPIKVRPGPDPGTYELKDGYLRLKSVQQLGWDQIPAEIKQTSDQEVIIESIITNKHRIEEDPITIAKKLDILTNAFGYTQKRLAEELGVSREWIANVIRLLKLPKDVQHCLALNNVSFYHGLLLLQVEDPQLQVQLAKEAKAFGWSTRELEARIKIMMGAPEKPSPPQLPESGKIEPVGSSAGFEPAGREPATETHPFVQPTSEPIGATPPGFLEVSPEGSSEKVTVERTQPKPVEIDTGFEWECPECHQKFQLIHVNYPDGKVKHKLEAKN